MKICEIIERREHLTLEGFKTIVAIRACMNRGLSEELKLAFPDVVPQIVLRPLVENPQILDPNWLAGFTSAEGCYYVEIYKAKTKQGEAVKLVFQVSQHIRDEQLMRSLIKYLNCGCIIINRTRVDFRVTKFNDIKNIIIPFFQKYQIHGLKALDFADFCKVAEMMNKKEHLSAGGLENIKQIKARMNLGRKWNC